MPVPAKTWRVTSPRTASWRAAAIFYARRLVEALGIDAEHGVLRLSFLHYTSPAEIDQLIEALDQVL
jgi:selenocysteine lyase/cysteine desulfurase